MYSSLLRHARHSIFTLASQYFLSLRARIPKSHDQKASEFSVNSTSVYVNETKVFRESIEADHPFSPSNELKVQFFSSTGGAFVTRAMYLLFTSEI